MKQRTFYTSANYSSLYTGLLKPSVPLARPLPADPLTRWLLFSQEGRNPFPKASVEKIVQLGFSQIQAVGEHRKKRWCFLECRQLLQRTGEEAASLRGSEEFGVRYRFKNNGWESPDLERGGGGRTSRWTSRSPGGSPSTDRLSSSSTITQPDSCCSLARLPIPQKTSRYEESRGAPIYRHWFS